MKLTKTQADFVMYWVEWAKEEATLWQNKDDELWKQLLKRYQKGAN